jgi:polyhydroxyalkanoate synthesis regulator phasin
MPPAKRATSNSPKANSSAKPAAKRATGSRATKAAASSAAKATATSASKAAGRTATQAKSAATKTGNAAAGGAATTRRSAKNTGTTAKAGSTRTRQASGGDGITSVAEQLVKGTIKPQELVMLTRDRIRETLDEAASRGRVTRKDADELVAELVRRGRSQSDDFRSEIEGLLGRVETATKRARGSKPVDRLVRGADRARRAAGVGPSFPILDYDNLNVGQVQSRLNELSKPELRKVLTYERKHANRKTVVGAIEKTLS